MNQTDKLTNQISVLPNTALSRRLSEQIGFENQIALRALIGGLPAVVATLILLWVNDYSFKVQLTFGLLVVCFWLGFSFSISERITRPLQTLSNMLTALREGDYSIRARRARDTGALGEALREMNF
jgi:HAMP domain-containing protein